jgi:hypothetical protein
MPFLKLTSWQRWYLNWLGAKVPGASLHARARGILACAAGENVKTAAKAAGQGYRQVADTLAAFTQSWDGMLRLPSCKGYFFTGAY